MSQDYSQRRFERLEVDVSVTIEPASGDAFEATMMEVSAGGMSVETSNSIDNGMEVSCAFVSGAHDLIEIRGVVSWIRDGQFGIRFTGFDPASFVLFKEFLFANAHDPHSIEDEILLNQDTLPETY